MPGTPACPRRTRQRGIRPALTGVLLVVASVGQAQAPTQAPAPDQAPDQTQAQEQTPAQAQAQERLKIQSPVLILEFERMFTDSAYGRAVQGMLEAEAAALNAENRRIEGELSAEEQALTRARDAMSVDEFRMRAEAFDAKVQSIRSERLEKARALETRQAEMRRAFERAAAPVLEGLMNEAGAALILDQSQALVALSAIDITDAAIARVDAEGIMPESGDP